MSSSYEKSVKGGTKIKLAAPKSKYVEHILQATHTGEAGVAEIFRTMHNRLRDSTWTIVFKGLIITHLMIREGRPKSTLKFLADSPSKMAISNFSDVQVQGENIRHYHKYLLSRVKAYATTQIDWVLDGKGKLQKQSIDKGLLRETEAVQSQISALLKCDLFSKDTENEITLTAFRLLTMDLLALYHVSNEGAINVLEHYFEMSKPDAERALRIYRTFARQTDQVVAFLSVARQYEGATRLEIPKLKHAPTGLASSLEEYLHDPDFEINRRQYVAQKEAKKSGKPGPSDKNDISANLSKLNVNGSSSKSSANVTSQSSSQPPAQSEAKQQGKGPAPDLIDFFDSIEQNQQPMRTAPAQQMPNAQNGQFGFQQSTFGGQAPQAVAYNSTNPFANMMAQSQQTGFNGAQPTQQQQPFGSTTLTSIPQDSMATFQPQSFTGQQQSVIPTGQLAFQQQQQFTNGNPSFFDNNQQAQQQSQQQQMSTGFPAPMQPNLTGSNPFRTNLPTQQTSGSGQSPFGQSVSPPVLQQSTNPFRASMLPVSQTNSSPFTSPAPTAPTSATSSFFSAIQSPQSQSFQPQPDPQPLQTTRTGTNPFKSAPPSTFHTPLTSPLAPQQTGTNPFRQSAFVNQATGQGWQASQGTMGGLEQLGSTPVFPRPAAQSQPWPS